MDDSDAKAAEIIWETIGGLSRFAALAVLADLGAADHLEGDPLSPDELADRCAADPVALRRVLRELAAINVVARTGDGRYALTEAGATLCTRAPGSMRPVVQMNAHPAFRYAMDALPQTVRTGGSAFAERYGHLYDHLAGDPATARLFDRYMTARTIPLCDAVATAYDFTRMRRVVDVGGGRGHMLAAILAAHPHLTGVLFELEHVLPGARDHLTEAGLAGRCEFAAGDFFTGLPPGADAYLLASVLHNWSDDAAVRILRSVRAAMAPDGRVLLAEHALPDHDRPHLGTDTDIRMLAIFGEGTERSEGEYATLLGRAGLALTRTIDLPAGFALMEARPEP